MKTWLKENWFKVGILVIIIIALSSAFYWFEWRPRQIKKECANWALIEAKGGLFSAYLEKTPYTQDQYDDYYIRCLREKGL